MRKIEKKLKLPEEALPATVCQVCDLMQIMHRPGPCPRCNASEKMQKEGIHMPSDGNLTTGFYSMELLWDEGYDVRRPRSRQ